MSPVDRAGSVTGMSFALGSYEKFQPGFRDFRLPGSYEKATIIVDPVVKMRPNPAAHPH